MLVKIKQACMIDWYYHDIGKVFEVENYGNTFYSVVNKEIQSLILKNDCEVVSEDCCSDKVLCKILNDVLTRLDKIEERFVSSDKSTSIVKEKKPRVPD